MHKAINVIIVLSFFWLVVSFRHHDNNSRMHRLADDHLNMLNVCMVWGNNAGETI